MFHVRRSFFKKSCKSCQISFCCGAGFVELHPRVGVTHTKQRGTLFLFGLTRFFHRRPPEISAALLQILFEVIPKQNFGQFFVNLLTGEVPVTFSLKEVDYSLFKFFFCEVHWLFPVSGICFFNPLISSSSSLRLCSCSNLLCSFR